MENNNRRPAPRNSGKKNETGKAFLKTFIYMLIVLGLAVILAMFMVTIAKDVLSLDKPEHEAEVVITESMTLSDISGTLAENDLIRYPWVFNLFSKFVKYDTKFKPGTYTLNTEMDYLWICSVLKSKAATKETVWVTIPEGFEIREIFERLEEKGVCKTEDLYRAMGEYESSYNFIKNLPDRENKLEGYLFPDTYEFYKDDTPENVFAKMLSNFDLKFDEEMADRAKEVGMTVDEVVILASIVEREAANDDDRETVASVFLNRIKSSNYPYLQSCATVQYVLKEKKAILSIADTKIESPYNTYSVEGLPVGPIASPGKASLEAVLYAPKTDYYFFVLGASGDHIFSKNLKEHEQAIKQAKNSSGTATVG